MAVWTDIADADLDPDSPLTTGLMTAYRENDIAVMEKASGAPVLANNYIVGAMMSTGSVSSDKIDWPNSEGITQLQLVTGEENSTTSTSWVTIRTVKAYIPGESNFFECWAELRVGSGGTLGYVRLKVGAATATGVGNDISTYAWLGADSVAISASSGWTDIEIQAYTTNASSAVTIRNVTVRIK